MERREVTGICPICGQEMEVTRLHCHYCDTTLEGHFGLCKFCKLTREQRMFVEVFIASRGNIKEVERTLGISYPTVRSRLDQVIEALGYKVSKDGKEEEEERNVAEQRRQILAKLDRGELSTEEAIQLLKEYK